MKSFILKINAQVIDQDGNQVVISQNLEFAGRAPAIHGAIQKMGDSFIYGLGVSLSREMLGEPKEEKAKV